MSSKLRLGSSASVQSVGWLVMGAFVASLVSSGAISSYNAGSVASACVFSVLVLSAGLLAGWAGIPSLAHPALLAVGAYSATYGSSHNWSLERTVLVAVVVTFAVAAILGFVGARFSELYAALLTIAFALIALEIINRWPDVTGGDMGVPASGLKVAITGSILDSASNASVYASIALCVLSLIFATYVRRTTMRMRVSAAKSHAVAARTLGIAPEWQFSLAFAVSGALAGLAGIFFALAGGFVSSDSFSLDFGVLVIAAAVLGGFGSIGGAVVGGAFIALCPTLAQAISVDQKVLEGAILILVLLFCPAGLVPTALARGRRWRRMQGGTSTAMDVPPGSHGVAAGVVEPERFDPITASPGAEVLLAVDDLTVKFAGLTALSKVSLRLRAGEVLAIIGPNGAGKTTLLNVLSGIAGGARIQGTVAWKGKNLLDVSTQDRRRSGIARTFQHAEIFTDLTVRENLLCLRRIPDRAFKTRVEELLKDMGLKDHADDLPKALPFGLRKRLDLTRSIVDPPELLLLDEPFGGLDAHERLVTAHNIRRLCEQHGTSVLIIDHVLDELFALAGRVQAFDFGVSLLEGDPQTVMADPRVRDAYLGTASTSSIERSPTAWDSAADVMLRIDDASYHYDGVTALDGVSLEVKRGSIFGVVGANGAGKSTLGRAMQGERLSSGRCVVADLTGRRALVPEGRGLFMTLTIRENLEVAGYGAGLRSRALREAVSDAVGWLPERLRSRLGAEASTLSGGEQQMLAIGRALVSKPDLLILDEPALGLAPGLIDEVYHRIDDLAAGGTTIVLLEQLLSRALDVCHEIVVLHDGKVAARGSTRDPEFRVAAEGAYFGVQNVH